MRPTPFHKVMIANRGEIALRVMRGARALGYRTVAIYSTADAGSRHACEADQAVWVGDSPSAASYLNIERVVEAALRTGADAVHPGYGFLAESARFAAACSEANLVFIGPSPAAIEAMGDKAAAKRLAAAAGVPCIPGYEGEDQADDRLLQEARAIGFPIMIKACAGGGGRGIRRVVCVEEFAAALRSARSEAELAFGDPRVILEKAIASPRHVEVQVLADRYGKVIHLCERDCSVQRRHQKLIEEAPSPGVTAVIRERMGAAATACASAVGYEGAGTVEFLMDQHGEFYFMEMNTRLQVEHPVTEAVTGLDLVELQLRIAAGEPLQIQQEDVRLSGHAIEVRVCSEDADNAFAPQSGRMHLWRVPTGVRVEHALESGADIPSDYDSMIAKLIGVGSSRQEARRRLILALDQLVPLGVPTNKVFLARCLSHPEFAAGGVSTDFIEREAATLLADDQEGGTRAAAILAALLQMGPNESVYRDSAALRSQCAHEGRFEVNGRTVSAHLEAHSASRWTVRIDEERLEVAILERSGMHVRVSCNGICEAAVVLPVEDDLLVHYAGAAYRVRELRFVPTSRRNEVGDGRIHASITGRVVAVHAVVGDAMVAGQPILTLEAMKMEHTHTAPVDGKLIALHAELDQLVTARRVVAEIQVAESSAETAQNRAPGESR